MKQRLVGALVLGSLAVIFIPALLDGEGLSSPDIVRAMPAPPPRPPVPDLQPERPVILADTPAIHINEAVPAEETAAVPARSEEAEPESAGPRLDERGIPAAWNVRLASFADGGNADSLVTNLQRNGYKGYSRPIDTSQGPLTAVYVGPVLTRAEADTLQQTLNREFGLEGLVVRFEIEEPQR